MVRGTWTAVLSVIALAAAAAAVVVALAAPAGSYAAGSRSPAYCTIPTKNYSPWGFHTGEAITGPTGSYVHGHGTFHPSAQTASGIMCQVDRVRNSPDRQIILSVDRHLVYYSHTARRWGYPGNLVKLSVRVKQSTDPNCPVGTTGLVTIFASYNGVHQDSVKFYFPAACKGHRHLSHSPSVVTNVEPA
jgi:hypothetical protein